MATGPSTPAITALADGRFVVAWAERAPTAGQFRVQARYLSAGGVPTSNPVTNNDAAYTASTTVLTEGNPPAIAALGDGLATVIAWRTGSAIRGRTYGSTGTPRTGTDFVLASRPSEEIVGEPQLAALAGDVALLYPRATLGGDADDGQLVLRRLNAAGQIIGSDAVVTDGVETTPAALAGAGATLAAAWTTCAADGDGDTCAVRWRRFDGNLAPLGPSRIANSTTAGSSTPPDRDGFGVRARIVYPDAAPTPP